MITSRENSRSEVNWEEGVEYVVLYSQATKETRSPRKVFDTWTFERVSNMTCKTTDRVFFSRD